MNMEVQDNVEIPIPEIKTIIPKITVASFNIQNSKDHELINDVAEEMESLKVDVLAVQGCNKLNNEVLFRAFKQRGYQYTRFDQMHTRTSGEIMFYSDRVTIRKKEYTKFGNSAQNRGTSKYRVAIGKNLASDPELWVITSHLEEGGSGNGYRKAQIVELGAMFSSCDIPVVFAGDTSIPSWQDLREPKEWLDGWREKGTTDNEKTTLLDRMDQIWYKIPNGTNLECTKYMLIRKFNGTRHGVMATFKVGF